MKGHIRQRSPGQLTIVLDARDPESGRCKWHSFKGSSLGKHPTTDEIMKRMVEERKL